MTTRQPQHTLSHVRVAAMSFLLILFFCGTSILFRTLPHDAINMMGAFFAGLIVTPIVASPIKWLVHRYVYHRSFTLLQRINAIHLAHHYLYFPTWRYVTGGPARRIPIMGKGVGVPQTSRLKNAMTYLAHFVFYMTLGAVLIWLPMWLVAQSVPFLLGAILAAVVISNLFIIVHDAIHRPGSYTLMEKQPWFCFLDEHHYIHHVDTEANVNFLLPFADLLFGTLRRDLTAAERAKHGSREAAKSHIAGVGEPAKETSTYCPPAMAVSDDWINPVMS